METLKKDLGEAEKQAQVIRDDLKKLQNRRTVDAHRLCDLSHLPLASRPFLAYPDGSCFLVSAIQDELNFVGIKLAVDAEGNIRDPTAVSEHPFYTDTFIEATGRSFDAEPGERESWKL